MRVFMGCRRTAILAGGTETKKRANFFLCRPSCTQWTSASHRADSPSSWKMYFFPVTRGGPRLGAGRLALPGIRPLL